MNYGEFSSDGKEYLIKLFDLPRPWINYLTNGKYCALVSHTGGGYSFFQSSGYNRILRASPSEILSDQPGRYIYLRDDETGEYWSLNWQPVQKPPTSWQARQGLGYTQIDSACCQIEGRVKYFVPLEDNLEVWQVTLTNQDARPRRLSIFIYVEWSLGDYIFDLIETSFADLFNILTFEECIIYATKSLWDILQDTARPNIAWDKYAFLTANFTVEGFDCLRENFQGRYRSLKNPIALEKGDCSNSQGRGKDSVGVLHHRRELAAGEQFDFTVLLGVAQEKEKARTLAEKYRPNEAAEKEFQRLQEYWQKYLDSVWVETPDAEFNLSVNIWNKYQAWVISHWARMDSFYLGGGYMIGFRDRAQDLLGILPTEPARARNMILELLMYHFQDGSSLHSWEPITNLGSRTGHSDDPLWLVLITIYYLKESGDFSFLEEKVGYYDRGRGSVYEHIIRAIDFTLSRRSERGIPLIGAGDWNDALDYVGEAGKGESIMVAQMLCWALREMVELADYRGDKELKEKYNLLYQELKEKINQFCWDGQWYIRATTDEGYPLGSSTNEQAKIFLNTQSWAIISGIASPERALLCMDSARKYLDTQYGPAIFLPAYDKPDPKIGIITRFSPGTKENGAIFNHPVSWAVMAEAILGRGDLAYQYFKKTSFVSRGEEPEIYQAEPYIYAEFVHGPDSPYFGQAEFSWATGTAAWMWRVCLDWILGIRPEWEGLRIDPCIPRHWPGYRARRSFREAVYEIEVKNPKRVCRGVKRVTVDGKEWPSNLLPVFRDSRVHSVEVVL